MFGHAILISNFLYVDVVDSLLSNGAMALVSCKYCKVREEYYKMEGTEEDRILPRPSTVISPIQGYVGPENPYHPVYMMPLYTYPHRYSYHWGNQHPPTMSYPPSSNLERFQETSQHPVQSSTMPDESEERMSIMNDGFVSVMDVDDEFRVRNVF
ncbi:uncharacterized protein LOC121234044 isoform X1 [Juglans microcarpa x Juglans regia]|uniref:uncharacterized protein LOC121234044 isoform X1 n=1 Tax=Juglans microcarpa x Juglans regia TaxID=2249226 RepID=UPI001B7EDF12|nr:uncharacterized protein LOC121234044 isoform X1 [Juglans microcarpa x Juglans regia]